MKSKNVEITSWYNRPEWFEIGFDKETKKEADFFQRAFKRWCPFRVRKLFEPACGSGRLITEMAERGYQMTGFDLSQPSIDYLRQRLKRDRLKAHLFLGDMSNFRLPGKQDSGYCTYNTFRHLTTEAAAVGHLRSAARSIRSGGLYFLGLHLAPPDCEPLCIERWIGQRGRTHVTTTLRVTASSRRTRLETLRINVLVRELNHRSQTHTGANGVSQRNGNGKPLKLSENSRVVGRLQDEFDYRMYSAFQIRQLFASVPQFELLEVYDFWYDLDDPQKLDNDLVDALFVLRRR